MERVRGVAARPTHDPGLLHEIAARPTPAQQPPAVAPIPSL